MFLFLTHHTGRNFLTLLPAWFFYSLTPVWTGACRTGPAGRLTPCSTLSRCSMPQTLPWLQCFYAKVSLSIRLSDYPPPAAYVWALLTLFLLLLRFLVWSAILPYLMYRADKCIFAQLMTLHHPKDVSNVFVSFKIFLFLVSKMTRLLQKNITILIFSFQGSFRLKISACQSTPYLWCILADCLLACTSISVLTG